MIMILLVGGPASEAASPRTAPVATASVSAQPSPSPSVSSPPTITVSQANAQLRTVIANAQDWLMKIIAAVATFFLTLGGVKYMSSGGDPSEVERAKGSLKNAGIGYGLAILAPVILAVLQGILGVG